MGVAGGGCPGCGFFFAPKGNEKGGGFLRGKKGGDEGGGGTEQFKLCWGGKQKVDGCEKFLTKKGLKGGGGTTWEEDVFRGEKKGGVVQAAIGIESEHVIATEGGEKGSGLQTPRRG